MKYKLLAANFITFISQSAFALPSFNYNIDSFSVQKNGNVFFQDTFSDGIEPTPSPSAFNNYFTGGTFANNREQNGKLSLAGADAVFSPSALGNPTYVIGATLNSSVNSTDLINGLKVDDLFSVAGRFDLLGGPANSGFGIRLTDGTGSVVGNDIVDLRLVNRANGQTVVRLQKQDFVLGTTTILQDISIALNDGDQIELILSRDNLNTNTITAAFQLLNGGVSSNLINFNSTADIFNGEAYTRANFRAFGPDGSVPSPATLGLFMMGVAPLLIKRRSKK